MAEVACNCGKVTIAVQAEARDGALIVCHCPDCRAFPRILGRDDIPDEAGGMWLWQTTPDKMQVVTGLEDIAALRLTPRGPLRWYAACCDTPLALTPGLRGIPFVSFLNAVMRPAPDVPPVAKVFRKHATGKVAKPYGSLVALVAVFASRTLAARLRGAHNANPLFGADGRAIVKPTRPDAQTRARAYSA